MAEKKLYYGGQAVIEGVMMRGKENMVTAVRRPNGEIGLEAQQLAAIYSGKWRRTPLARGVIVLIESLILGIKTLMYSANVALEEEKAQLSGWAVWAILLPSLAFAVAVFFVLPLFVTNLFSSHFPSSILFNFVEGLVRLAIFLGYLLVISRMRDIKRVFAYHGAEHKAVNAYEAGVPLEVESARPFSTAHVRCGTSFLFAVLVIAIIVFSVIGKPNIAVMAISRIILVPVIASIGYEFTYFSARHVNNPFIRALMTPGLWIQKLTTREPDDKQLEVALTALKKVVEIEESQPAPMSPQVAAAAVS